MALRHFEEQADPRRAASTKDDAIRDRHGEQLQHRAVVNLRRCAAQEPGPPGARPARPGAADRDLGAPRTDDQDEMNFHDELDVLLGAGPDSPDADLAAALSRLGRSSAAPAPRPSAALAAYLPLAIATARTSTIAATPVVALSLHRPPEPRRLVVPAMVVRIAVAAVAAAAVAASVVAGQALRSDPNTTVRVVTPATTGDDTVDPSTTTTPSTGQLAPPGATDPASSTSTDRSGQAPAPGESTSSLPTPGVSTSGRGGRDAVRATDDATSVSTQPTPALPSTDRPETSASESREPATAAVTTAPAAAPSTAEPSTSDDATPGDASGSGRDAPSGEMSALGTEGHGG